MTDFKALIEADSGQPARNIQLLDIDNFEDWLKGQPDSVRAIVAAYQFVGKPDTYLLLPPVSGQSDDKSVAGDFSVVAGVQDHEKLDPWSLARLGSSLPEGTYRLQEASAKGTLFGWLISQHEFDRYKELPDRQGPSVLLVKDAIGQRDEAVRQAEATAMVRDMVNTPAADMGPDKLEDIVDKLAEKHGAEKKKTLAMPIWSLRD